MDKAIWTPSPARVAGSNLRRFIEKVNKASDRGIGNYAQLYKWSIEKPEEFWPEIWNFCGIRASRQWETVLTGGDRMPGSHWFLGARLNFAENLLRRADDKTAILFRAEDRRRTEWTYADLNRSVAALATAMRLAGVQKGDRIAGYMPNLPETVVAMLASASMGAIWSACSPDFGVAGAVERFSQITPKLLFCADGYFFKGKEDRIFYYTTCGWMMWNWLISSLACGCTVMLYDGSPSHPSPDALFKYASEDGTTIFGTSARYLTALEKSGAKPKDAHDLHAIKTILSTGSPLHPESFDYVYRDIKSSVQLSSISGGTDIVSCFALGNPLLPVYRGELQCRGLGMKVAIYDQSGQPLLNKPGELVCEAPAPSMPIRFWNDASDKKYMAAYFERYPGVWAHGDYARLTESGGMVIYGRSDAVLNPGGVRIGTAEIYRPVEHIEAVMESIAVGQEWDGDIRILLFVKLRDGVSLTEALKNRIKAAIRENTSPHHVPAKIISVSDIPRTISGKIVELAVRDVIHRRPVANIEALANPEALDIFKNLPEIFE